jgi:GNAT superfamily N-acetyltransferase
MNIQIVPLTTEEQAELWEKAFRERGFNRPEGYYSQCLRENLERKRVTLFAMAGSVITGCAHLKYESEYPYFSENGIPEINDLNVFPEYRRQGIANQLMDAFETIAAESGPYIGIGVGMFTSYGAAQRLYCRRGYIPDGRGLTYNNEVVEKGSHVRVDDELALYFTKSVTKLT